ncbi:MAG: LURP-one-related family protein [Bacilli bacterium]|nr:LURP-one-related family protein [Bacilli bacterium]
MKLLLKQKIWSWFDSFDIWDENGEVLYRVKGHMSWGHAFRVYDKNDNEVAEIKQRIWTWTYKFDIIQNGIETGMVHKQFTWLKPKFDINFNNKNYDVIGNWVGWDYSLSSGGKVVATIHKEIWNWADTYSINVDKSDELTAVILVVAIDAIKCCEAAARS